ncbi:MAG: DUF6796 family protein [Bacteroidota bacterium]
MPQGNAVSGVKVFIAIGMFASLLGCVSDGLLLYTPDAVYHEMDFQFFTDISKIRLLIGQYLGIFSIPFCLMGFWWLTRGLRPWNENAPWYAFSMMIIAMFLGVAYHACLPLVAMQVQSLGGVEFVRAFFMPLGTTFALLYFLLSLAFLLTILFRETLFPRWLIWFNPIVTYLVCLAFYLWVPSIGNFLIVAGFNLANLILLGGILWANWDQESVYFDREL